MRRSTNQIKRVQHIADHPFATLMSCVWLGFRIGTAYYLVSRVVMSEVSRIGPAAVTDQSITTIFIGMLVGTIIGLSGILLVQYIDEKERRL